MLGTEFGGAVTKVKLIKIRSCQMTYTPPLYRIIFTNLQQTVNVIKKFLTRIATCTFFFNTPTNCSLYERHCKAPWLSRWVYAQGSRCHLGNRCRGLIVVIKLKCEGYWYPILKGRVAYDFLKRREPLAIFLGAPILFCILKLDWGLKSCGNWDGDELQLTIKWRTKTDKTYVCLISSHTVLL